MNGILASLIVLQAAPVPLELVAQPWVECTAPVLDLALAHDGARLFTLTETRERSAWYVKDGVEDWRHADEHLVAIDAAKTGLLGTGAFPAALLFDPETGVRVTANGYPDPPAATLVADPDGRWVWIGTQNGLVRLVPGDVQTFNRRPLENGGVTRLALDGTGKLLAAGGKDGTVRFANAQGASVDEKRVLVGPASPVSALAFGPKVLIVAHEDRSVRLWKLATNKLELELAPGGAPVWDVVVPERAAWFAYGDGDGQVLLRSLTKDVVLARGRTGAGPIKALVLAEKPATLYVASGKKVFTFDLSGVK
ncbi:MAG TPA: WD40 repeat domain-containing protein [Planctomycetota bacterium]